VGFERCTGLRWADVDLEAKALSIVNNRVVAGNRSVENDPRSVASGAHCRYRTAWSRCFGQRRPVSRLSGSPWGGGAFNYVVSNEAGEPYAPAVLSRYWRQAVKAAGVRHVKLHAARHTCATLMQVRGVPAP